MGIGVIEPAVIRRVKEKRNPARIPANVIQVLAFTVRYILLPASAISTKGPRASRQITAAMRLCPEALAEEIYKRTRYGGKS